MKILCIGHEWRGSNSSGLFYSLSRKGWITNIVNDQLYVPTQSVGKTLKAVQWSLRPFQVKEFNNVLKSQFNAFLPDLVLVYKGSFILPETIKSWQSKGIPTVLFYPDVSFLSHGKYIPKCIPLYDHIFSTKTFAVNDLIRLFNLPPDKVSFIPHGFDPLLHRPIKTIPKNLKCDISFIGGYTQAKAEILRDLVVSTNSLDIKIWGGGWSQNKYRELKPYIQNKSLFGDAYVAAISASSINLGLLSEKVRGASSGDLITSRTFHIPGSGGFLLHERTYEVVNYFEENVEAAFFGDSNELVKKVEFFLKNDSSRNEIARRGYERALKEHSLECRADKLIRKLKELGLV